MTAEQIGSVGPGMARVLGRFGDCFSRAPTFEHLRTYLLGLMSDVPRKNVESIALAAGTPVRSLQEFLAQFKWDHERVNDELMRLIADEHGGEGSVGVVDGSGHPKKGDKTPGVQRQYCGQSGKLDNCVVGVHLLYTDNHASNPFSCMLDSELYLPKSWAGDAARRKEAGIPDELFYRPKWLIALNEIELAISRGVRMSWLTFDEEFGMVPDFWFTLDAMGQRAIGEVPRSFLCWPTPPKCRSLRAEHAAHQVQDVSHSPAFYGQEWKEMKIKDTTRGPMVWLVKANRVQLVEKRDGRSEPTDRRYWLIIARNPRTDEIKYFISNAAENATLAEMLRAALARWHVEKWFERAKQEVGFGDFEVRRYVALIRHWLCCRIAMLLLAGQTRRLRGKNPRITFEQVARLAQTLLEKLINPWRRSWRELIRIAGYHQTRNAAAYLSRNKRTNADST